LQLVFAAPACEPGQDTSVAVDPRLHHLALGRPLFLTARLPYATGLASSLSGCFLPTGQRYFFILSPTSGRCCRILPRSGVLPGAKAHFVMPFGFFRLADSLLRNRQSP